jgi:hypothetical protein
VECLPAHHDSAMACMGAEKPCAAHTVLTENDAIEAEVDWAEERTPRHGQSVSMGGAIVAARTLPAKLLERVA